jgi:hypothetical protein
MPVTVANQSCRKLTKQLPELRTLAENSQTTAEFAKAMLEIVKMRDSLGPTLTFMLAD